MMFWQKNKGISSKTTQRWICLTPKSDLSETKILSLTITNSVTRKAGAKHELSLNKPASVSYKEVYDTTDLYRIKRLLPLQLDFLAAGFRISGVENVLH